MSGIIAFGVILRWRLTKQVWCIFRRRCERLALTSAALFERRKAYRGQFSETTIAFTARRRKTKSFNPASTFTELRTSLQNDEDSRNQRKQPEIDSSLAMHTGNKNSGSKKILSQPKVCNFCGNPGHFAKQCNKRGTATCSKCNKRGHLAKACRNRESRQT